MKTAKFWKSRSRTKIFVLLQKLTRVKRKVFISAEDQQATNLLHEGAGTMRSQIISSEIIGGSEGGGGHTRDSIMSSVALSIPEPVFSGGSVDLSIRSKLVNITNYYRTH